MPVKGTWIREPDGATLLFYSPVLWNDPPTALRNQFEGMPMASFERFTRAHYDDSMPQWETWPKDVDKLKPGEWIRVH